MTHTTWILPFDTSMEIPQTDGSTITLGPKEVRVGSQTFPVPSTTGTTTLSAGGVSVTFQPGPPLNWKPSFRRVTYWFTSNTAAGECSKLHDK